MYILEQGFLFFNGTIIGEVKRYNYQTKKGYFTIFGLENISGLSILPAGWRVIQENDFLDDTFWLEIVEDVKYKNWARTESHALLTEFTKSNTKEDFEMFSRRMYSRECKRNYRLENKNN